MPDSLDGLDLTGITHRGFDDLRGWLLFDNLPAELQRQLDQTQADDHDRRHWRSSVRRRRPATPAERLLLEHLGFQLPTVLDAVVSYPSGGVHRVEFPALQKQREAMR